MKIAIITQPLESNYGGLLQNYALQQILKKMGHKPITFDQHPSLPTRIKIFISRLCEGSGCFNSFKKRYICATEKANNLRDFEKFEKIYKPDAYFVGSDQVWRPVYNRFLDCSYLAFSRSKRKIAYAASFGTDQWEYNDTDTEKYAKLLQSFKAIGVREQSAITLCKNHFKADAQLVLDPTLLLDSSDYQTLCLPIKDKQEYVFTYMLDCDIWKRKMVKQLCNLYSCKEIAGLYNANGSKAKRLSVEQWITYLTNATFVVCDSFHGTVFSILMHRPFIVLGNSYRGNTRLISLLQSVGLENRLLLDYSEISKLPTIEWDKVDQKLDNLRIESFNFIKQALSDF